MLSKTLDSKSPLKGEALPKPAPFLKWAGGKRALVPELRKSMPASFSRYFEPFLGAGSLFFSLPSDLPKHVSDFNSELISVYDTIRDDVDGVLSALRGLSNTKEEYLRVRSWDRDESFSSLPSAMRAARFIFLNKCGFNGLYRVNSKGQYNVPYGNPKNVDFVMESNLRAVGYFLNSTTSTGDYSVITSSGDYRNLLLEARGPGDFVYLDPPYAPISPTSNFVSYNENGFGEQQQRELQAEILRLTSLGVRVLLSNSAAPLITDDLYSGEAFRVRKIDVRRVIAASTSSRGLIQEVLIDNYAAVEASS